MVPLPESAPRPLAPSPRLPLTCRAPPAPRRRRELPPCPNSLPPPAETRNSPPTAIVSSAQLRSRSEPHLKKSSTGSVDASEPAMGQSDALFWCATRDWFVLAGGCRPVPRCSPPAQHDVPDCSSSEKSFTWTHHTCIVHPAIRETSHSPLAMLPVPSPCMCHDVSSELQSVRVSVLQHMVARVSL